MISDIDTRDGRMRPATLARFARPMSWIDILATTQGRIRLWWSEAVGLAEDDGLLVWNRKTRTWCLTEAGRERVKAAA